MQLENYEKFTRKILQVVAISQEEVPDKICNYDLCVLRMKQIDSSVINRAKRLKLLVQFGVGLEGRENVLVTISLFLGNNCNYFALNRQLS
jgi:phosphoglycerate dehydrogenase-like enzyme